MTTPEPHEVRIGSYLRSKADTNRCLSWLLDAAVAAGYKVPSPESSSLPSTPAAISRQCEPENFQTLGQKLREKQALKAAKRKERDEPRVISADVLLTVKYVVRTKELLDQAKTAARKGAKVPSTIMRAFERAIAARKRSAAWFRSEGAHCEQSNSQHQHFITVLENVFHIVRQCNPVRTDQGHGVDCHHLLNRFAVLEVEDIEDDFEDMV